MFTWCSVQVQRWKCYDPVEIQFSWFCFGRCTFSCWTNTVNIYVTFPDKQTWIRQSKKQEFWGRVSKKEKFWGRVSNKKKRCRYQLWRVLGLSSLVWRDRTDNGLCGYCDTTYSATTFIKKMNEKRPAALERSWPLYLTRNTKHKIKLSVGGKSWQECCSVNFRSQSLFRLSTIN